MGRFEKINYNNSGVGFIDASGFYVIKKEPYQHPIYRLRPKYSTWIIKLIIKYPTKKPRKSNRITITEYVKRLTTNE